MVETFLNKTVEIRQAREITCNDTLLKRLPQHFQDVVAVLWSFIQQENAMVRQRHVARQWHLTAPDRPTSEIVWCGARHGHADTAAGQATCTIPIVMSATAAPVRQDFVASLARPGGNITGLAFLVQGALEGKRLELLKDAVPGLSRVAFLVHGTAVPSA